MLKLLRATVLLASASSLGFAQPRTASLAKGVASQNPNFSGDVTQCRGYSVESVSASSTGGILASLSLIDKCAAYGNDVSSLTLSVEYETSSRLHVHIFDTAKKQYQLDDWILPRPAAELVEGYAAEKSDLEFEYNESPFEFWVTRKSDGEVLFDTRAKNIPTHDEMVDIEGEPSGYTVMPAHPLIFEDQYLQVSSALPVGANIYGLGEVISGSGYRRNSSGAMQTMWARDAGDPVDENVYGSHAMYMELRWNEKTEKTAAHGAFLLNSHGMDVVLRDGVIQYRAIGGTLDFYFLSGPTPNEVAEQYAHTVGLPQAMPFWSFGFHLCKWGYSSIAETKENVESMRAAGVPLEVQYNDIDWMRRYREFQFDVNFDPADFKAFIEYLHSNNQRYIPIIDAAVGMVYNETDSYDFYQKGHELDVWMHNPDGSEFVGQVWPGLTVFPDWFHPDMSEVWYEGLQNFSKIVEFDGIWLDMNEPSSFVSGTQAPPSLQLDETADSAAQRRTARNRPRYRSSQLVLSSPLGADPAVSTPLIDVDNPAYPIRNGAGELKSHTVDVNVVHNNGLQEYHVHNVWGAMEEIATNDAIKRIKPGTRPFIVSRSTFAGVGRKTAHWLGDNYSTWEYMKRSIQGVLQFNLFAIPMVGPDTCGFAGDTTEELCNRWMQMSAFFPFYRNHNTLGAIPQEPYRWDSVIKASITAINARYALLPYWETLFAEAAASGSPPVRALFHEFDNPAYYDNDSQFMVGPAILVTPQLEPGQSTVTGTFPSAGGVTWTNFFTHEKVDTSNGEVVEVDAPLSTIPVHVRSGSAILMHSTVGYTLTETKAGGYSILVVLDHNGEASGSAKVDDGMSWPVTAQTHLDFLATSTSFRISASGDYIVPTKINEVIIVGVPQEIEVTGFTLNGNTISGMTYKPETEELILKGLGGDLNGDFELRW